MPVLASNPSTPKRKLPILRMLFASLLLLFLLFLFQLFGPNPTIIVSKQTTFITEPLGPDGLPDYKSHLLQQGAEGITHENNGAVLFWQSMWPGELDQKHWLPLCNALGMRNIPTSNKIVCDPFDQSVCNQLVSDLLARFPEPSKSKEDVESEEEFGGYGGEVERSWRTRLATATAQEVIEEASSKPWTSEQLPSLAEWLQQREDAFSMLVEATKRSRYYSPSPSLLDDPDSLLINTLLPSIQMMRSAQRALRMRAMWHLGEGLDWAAWQDMLACHRLARFARRNNTLLGQLVGMAVDSAACQGTQLVLHRGKFSLNQLREIQDALRQLQPIADCSRAIDLGERLMFLDAAISLARENPATLEYMGDFSKGVIGALNHTRVDWNVVLRMGNVWYDRFVDTAKISGRAQRLAAVEKLDQDMARLLGPVNSPSAVLGALLNKDSRSEAMGKVLLGMFLPAISAALDAEDRAATNLELTRLAAALAVYRAEQGEYPEQLTGLVPAVISQLPVDLYSGKPFLYERKDDGGYLLYSVYQNEIDDRGTANSGEIIEGEWVDESPEMFDSNATDLVVRVPVPRFRFPEPPSEEEFSGYGGEYIGGFGEGDFGGDP